MVVKILQLVSIVYMPTQIPKTGSYNKSLHLMIQTQNAHTKTKWTKKKHKIVEQHNYTKSKVRKCESNRKKPYAENSELVIV